MTAQHVLPGWFMNKLSTSIAKSVETLCTHCSGETFCPSIFLDLIDAKHDACFQTGYVRPASDLYASILKGCRWCSVIGYGIRGIAEHVQTRNSDDDDIDYREPGWFPIQSLDCAANLRITLRFLKYDESHLFNVLEVKIEVWRTTTDDGECALPQLVGDDSIYLRLELSSSGTL
jgi:hypothetical protein